MLRIGSSLKNLRVMSLHVGYPVGVLTEPIINPHNLIIVAFYAESQDVTPPAALLTQDIRETGGNKVIIDNEQDISPVSDLIRLKEVIKINFELVGKKVVTEGGRTLGKVDEYIVNDTDYIIQKLHVKQPLTKSVTGGKLIVDRKQVVSTDDKKITVKEGTEKVRVAKPSLIASPSN